MRVSITHYKGKTEVVAVTNEPIKGVPHSNGGVVIFKLLRGAKDAPDKGRVAIAGRNPDAIWFSGYTDRVIFDELGLFDEYIALEKGRNSLSQAAVSAAE